MFSYAPPNSEKNRRTPEETMTESRLLDHARPNRRSLLKSAALGSVAAFAAPYVKSSYAAGSLSLGVWDHWVPGANKALDKLCTEWGAKNNCEAKIDCNWKGVPTAVGSQVKPCCSRFDLYQQHAGIDIRDIFPADESKWDKT